jgi:hypothetical protein
VQAGRLRLSMVGQDVANMFLDPTFLGWFTTGAYFAAAVLCALAAQAYGREKGRRSSKSLRNLWVVIAIGLIALAVNKQLDLQTLLTDWMRDAAERGGWYGRRRVLQAAFVLAAVIAAAGGLWLILRTLGGRWREHRLMLAGLAAMCVYVLLRVADIERVGEMTGMSLAAENARTIIEWTGLAFIGVAGWRRAVRM